MQIMCLVIKHAITLSGKTRRSAVSPIDFGNRTPSGFEFYKLIFQFSNDWF
jgi:hypothetical protein